MVTWKGFEEDTHSRRVLKMGRIFISRDTGNGKGSGMDKRCVRWGTERKFANGELVRKVI